MIATPTRDSEQGDRTRLIGRLGPLTRQRHCLVWDYCRSTAAVSNPRKAPFGDDDARDTRLSAGGSAKPTGCGAGRWGSPSRRQIPATRLRPSCNSEREGCLPDSWACIIPGFIVTWPPSSPEEAWLIPPRSGKRDHVPVMSSRRWETPRESQFRRVL